MFDVWDLIQHRQIMLAEENTAMARREADRVDDRLHQEVRRLEAKVDALGLVCEAMWELIGERTGLTRDDIHRKMDEIDLRDGRTDGKISAVRTTCARCHRPANTGQTKCIYCDAPLDDTTPEDQA